MNVYPLRATAVVCTVGQIFEKSVNPTRMRDYVERNTVEAYNSVVWRERSGQLEIFHVRAISMN